MANQTDPFAVPDPYGTSTDAAINGPTDPYQLDGGTIGAYELQSQALNQASLSSYGSPMNPQAVLDALKTGSSNSILGAMGDPTVSREYGYMLSATPAGMQPQQNLVQAGSDLNLNTDQAQQLYSYDPKTQGSGKPRSMSVDLFGKKQDDSLAALEETPVMNLGYMADVRGTKDTNRIKRWQDYLKKQGFTAGADGQWDAPTDQAFVQYMSAKFMPEALYGKNKPLARVFENELGLNVESLIKETGRDGLQRDAFLGWMNTQDHSQARKSLSDYIDKYGDASVPDSYKKLTGSWFDTIKDTLAGIPILGRAASVPLNILDIGSMHSPTDIFEDNRDLRAAAGTYGLSKADLEAVSGVVEDAKHSVGWFGALDNWDRARSRTIVGLLWDFKDHGLDVGQYHWAAYGSEAAMPLGMIFSPSNNLFDEKSDWGKAVSQGQTDMLDNVPWMHDWFTAHTTSTGILNFAANLLDDPTTYTGFGGIGKAGIRAVTGLHDVLGATKVTRPLVHFADRGFAPWTTNDIFLNDFVKSPSQHLVGLVQEGTDQEVRAQRGLKLVNRFRAHGLIISPRNLAALDEMAHVVRREDVHAQDVAKLLNLDLDSPDVAAAMKGIKAASSHPQAVRAIADVMGHTGLAHGSFAHNYYSALRGISPTMAVRLSSGKINRILAQGSLTLSTSTVDLRNPLRAADRMVELGHAIGMPDSVMRDMSKAMASAKDNEERGAVIDAFNMSLEEHFNKNPKWAAIQYGGETGWKAFQEWQRSARLVPIDDLTDRAAGQPRLYSGKMQDVGSEGAKVLQEQNLVAASGAIGRVFNNNRLMKIIDETTKHHLSVLDNIPGISEDLARLTQNINESTLGEAIRLMRTKMEATVDTKDRAFLRHIVASLEEGAARTQHLRDELASSAKDGPLRGAPRDTDQLQYLSDLHATPAEILSFTNPALRVAENTQRLLKADSYRSFWANIEIARPSSAFRITLGDEVSRFFFHLMMNGHPIPAFRYLGKEMAALPLKGVRAVTRKTLNKKVFDDPRLAANMSSIVGITKPGGHAAMHVSSPHFAKGLGYTLLHHLSKGRLTTGWLDEWSKHHDISQELKAAEEKWYRDQPAAQAHLDTAYGLMNDRGLNAVADDLHSIRNDWEDRMAEGRTPIKVPDGRELTPQFNKLDRRTMEGLAGDLRAAGDKKAVKLLNLVNKYRQTKDADKLEALLSEASEKGKTLEGKDLLGRFQRTRAASKGPLESEIPPIDLMGLRHDLGGRQTEPAIQHIHRLILATHPRMDQYRELARIYRDGEEVPVQMRTIEREWADVGATKDEIAQAIDAFVAKHDNPEFLHEIHTLRNANRLYDLGKNDPWMTRTGEELASRKQGVVDAIQKHIDQNMTSDEQLRELNNMLREADPDIGMWSQRGMKLAAENELKIAENTVRSLKRDPNYYGYMSTRGWAERQHQQLMGIFAHPLMTKWVKEVQKAPTEAAERATWEKKWYQGYLKEIGPILNRESFDGEHTLFPTITQPLRTMENLRSAGGLTRHAMNSFHESVTGAMVTHARGMGMETLLEQRLAGLRSSHPDWFDTKGRPLHEAQWRANAYAYAWLERNTYQGQRTVMGGTLRNAFPFWGATANMSRFWMRQLAEHKHWQAPFLHTLDAVDQNKASGGLHLQIPGTAWAMAKITGSQGDDATFDPLSPFFFTSDGVGGFVPGMGPYLSLGLDMMASHDPHDVDALMSAFGPLGDVWKTHINNSVDNPLLSWVPGVAQGAYQMATGHTLGHIPFVTNNEEIQKKDVLNRVQEEQATRDATGQASPGPEQATTDATRSVGVDDFAKGIINFLAPVGMRTADAKGAAVSKLEKVWDAADDKGKNQILGQEYGIDPTTISKAIGMGQAPQWVAQHPDSPANLLLYFDRRLSEDDKHSIAFHAPWVVAYGTSKYDQQNQVELTSNAQEFGHRIADGSIDLLSPQAFIGQMTKNREFNQAATEYALLSQQERQYLAESGNSSSSPEAKAWRNHFFYPRLNNLIGEHREWANQFLSQSRKDLQGLLVSTRPLRSLMNWEVIPQFDDMNSTKVNLWRQTFRDLNDAVTSIRDIRSAGSGADSAAAVQVVLQDFKKRLEGYKNLDDSYGDELDRFHYGRLEDLINMDVEGRGVGG